MKDVILAALAFAAAAAPASAQARQTPGSPVTIETCYPHRHTTGQRHGWIDPYGNHRDSTLFRLQDGFLAIDYRNDGRVAATEIDFGLVARRTLVAVAKDAGTFSPGVTIRHEFVISQEVFPLGTQFPYCAVLRVKFADGSSWRNPNPPPE